MKHFAQALQHFSLKAKQWWSKPSMVPHHAKQPAADNLGMLGHGLTAPLPLLLRTRVLAKQLQMPKLRQMTAGNRSGENLSKRGRGVHFEETRIYQAGDDIRHIDWRVTARTGETHTKVFREEHERPMVFLIDLNPRMHFGTQGCYKSVLASQIAATLSFAAVNDGNPVGGLIMHQTLKRSAIHGKERGVLPLLNLLTESCEQAASQNVSFESGLQNIQPMLKSGTLLVIISDFFDISPKSESLLAQMAYRHPLWLLQTLDPIEVAPPKSGHYGISDGANLSWLNTADTTQREGYLRFCRDKQEKIKAISRKLGLLHATLYTNQALLPQLTTLTQGLSRL